MNFQEERLEEMFTRSPRRRQIVCLLMRGVHRKTVSAQLGMSPHTLHDHLKAMYRSLGIGSCAQLLTIAFGLARYQVVCPPPELGSVRSSDARIPSINHTRV